MNVKRFTGRTSREAMQKVKAAFGDDAVGGHDLDW